MIKITKKDKTDDRVDIFELDGQVYSIPAKPRANIILRYMRAVRNEGEEVASAELLEAMLGEEAYDAILASDDVDVEDFQNIMELVQKHVLGSVETLGKGAGNS